MLAGSYTADYRKYVELVYDVCPGWGRKSRQPRVEVRGCWEEIDLQLSALEQELCALLKVHAVQPFMLPSRAHGFGLALYWQIISDRGAVWQQVQKADELVQQEGRGAVEPVG